ncbi:MAG: N-acetyltransferase family protein [Sphingopyxis sp.]
MTMGAGGENGGSADVAAQHNICAPMVADAPALAAMAQAAFRATFAHMPYPPHELTAFLDEAMGPARYAAQIADPAYALRVARDGDGAIVGFIKMGPNDLPMPDGEPSLDQTRELHQLYLLDSAKGSGVAQRLMAWGMDEARGHGARALYLSVFSENIRAQRFYARHGFVEIGKNPFRVGSTVDDDRVWKCAL